MKVNLKLTYAGLAGLAVVSGAGYYIYKRWQVSEQDPRYILNKLRNTIFSSKKVNVNEILSVFSEAYNTLVGRLVSEYQHESSEEIKKRFCKKQLLGQYFYECLDCSATLQDTNLDEQDQENLNTYSHQICEDCFDQEIHKGHKYKLIRSEIEGKCDCGFSYLFKNDGNCCKHKGFKHLNKEFETSFPEDKKQAILEYFKNLFYILIDGQSDLIFSEMKKQKVSDDSKIKTDSLFTQYNMFLTLIIDQITELLDTNNSFVFIFSQLLQDTFTNPVRYQIDYEGYKILETKEVNQTTSIFEYILLHQSLLNEKSLQKLDDLLDILGVSDPVIVEFITLKYIKLLKFAIFESTQIDEEGQEFKCFDMPSLFQTCRIAYGKKFTDKLSKNYEDYLLNIARVLKWYIPHIGFKHTPEFINAQLLTHYFVDVFNSIEATESLTKLDEILDILLDLLYITFEKTKVITQDPANILEYLSQNLSIIEGNFNIQSDIQSMLYQLTSCAYRGLSPEKKDLVLKVLCRKYKQQIEMTYQSAQKHYADIKEHKTYLGLSIACYIINIVILSEGTELTSEKVMRAIQNNFGLENEQQIQEFINKIAYLLYCNLTTMCQHQNSYALVVFTQVMQQNLEYEFPIICFWQTLLSSDRCIYDSNMLAFQLISSVQKSNELLAYKFINDYLPENWDNEQTRYNNIIKPNIVLKNIMYDLTPFININRKLKNILGNENTQNSMIYAAKQVINNNIKWHPNLTKSYSEFVAKVSECISDKKLINEALKCFGEFNIKDDSLKINPLEELEETSLNIGRYFNNLQDTSLSKEYIPYQKFQVLDGPIEYSYEFQKEIIINSLINIGIFNKLMKCYKEITQEEGEQEEMLLASRFNFYRNIWNILIKQTEKNPHLFNQQQTLLIDEFRKIIEVKENKDILQIIFKEE